MCPLQLYLYNSVHCLFPIHNPVQNLMSLERMILVPVVNTVQLTKVRLVFRVSIAAKNFAKDKSAVTGAF